jgi:cobalt-zinc-cadmium efflux system membrane fusion protein
MAYASVAISVDQKKAIAIPRTSIIHLGEYRVVFVQEPGEADGKVRFQRLPIDVDESMQGPYVAVKHGVVAGQLIVARGADALAQKL